MGGSAGTGDLPRLTVLGSGTLVPSYERRSAAHLLETPAGARLLMDCGTGTLHGFPEHGIGWEALGHVAISHYHNDHVGDLSGLLFALKHGLRPPRTEPLVLIGPPGFGGWLEALDAAVGGHILDPGFDVQVVEVGEGAAYEGPDFRLTATPTRHTPESVAFRVEGAWGSAGYTGDTGPSEAVAAFLAGVDVLVCECALSDPPEMDLHLSPAGVAELARVATPEILVVTHVYPPLEPAQAARRIAGAGYDGAVVAAYDGFRVLWSEIGEIRGA